MESNKTRIFCKVLLLVFVLCIGLYFGVRIGEGRYSFYEPHSPYYSRATIAAHSDGYSEGYDEGHKDKQEEDYNSGWSAGYKFCLNENKAIRNDYDEGYSDGYDEGYSDGYIEGHSEGYDEGYDDALDD